LAVRTVSHSTNDVVVFLPQLIWLQVSFRFLQLLIKLVLKVDIFDGALVEGALIALLTQSFVSQVI